MEFGNKAIYDGRFCGNILVVGTTACGKTYLLQKLGFNKFFGKLVKIEWVIGIETDEQREAEIQSCFSNEVEFDLATGPSDLVSLIEKFKLRTRDITNNESNSVFGEQWITFLWTTSWVLLTIVKNCRIFSSLQKISIPLYLCVLCNNTRESNLEKDFITN